MTREAAYRILDEPSPSGLAHLIVHPMWPLLSIMLAGAWLAVPWFVLNSLALGSPTLRKELSVAVLGSLGVLALALGLGLLHRLLRLPQGAISYLFVLIVLWKLAVGYWLFDLQKRTFALHEYFGGAVRNGMLVVAAGYLLKGWVLKVPFGGAAWWHLLVG